MVRAAAKNYKYVSIVTNSNQYESIMDEMNKNDGSVSLETREKLALKAWELSTIYNAAIFKQIQKEFEPDNRFPDIKIEILEKVREHRYGGNWDQCSALYKERGKAGIADAEQIQGKEISFNNDLDIHSAIEVLFEIERFKKRNKIKEGYGTSWFKHNTPNGICLDYENELASVENAYNCDPLSAFGGVVGTTFEPTKEIAEYLNKIFVEVLVSPGFNKDVLEISEEKKGRRLLNIKPIWNKNEELHSELEVRGVLGGRLYQDYDTGFIKEWSVVSNKKPNEEQRLGLEFVYFCPTKWAISNSAAFVKTYDKGIKTIGIGAGQQSRVHVIKLAASKAREFGHDLKDSLMGTDSFFPFRDGFDAAVDAGAVGIITPGGSVRDGEIIDAANERGVVLVHCGKRVFRH